MRRALFLLLVLTPLAGALGCHSLGHQACDAHGDCACEQCRDGATGGGLGHGGLLEALHLRHARPAAQVGGPPIGTVTYPYYTVRGPRDFLKDEPTSIGP